MYKVVLNTGSKYTSLCGELEYGEKHFTAPNAEMWKVAVTGKPTHLDWEPCTITRML